jgi:hypothetical protein
MAQADRNFWVGQESRADRRRARQDIFLADVGVTESTLKRYYFAVSRMTHVLEQVSSEHELDELVAEWIQEEFEDGSPLYLIGDALSGLHHLEPYTKKRLAKSWRLYSIWRKFEVPCRAPPLPMDITLAMAGWCLLHDEIIMGALILLGFHALLRTGELLVIRPCDFILGKVHGLISIPSSKSGLRNNAKESVTIEDMYTLETVRTMVEIQTTRRLANVPCWTRSGTAFRSLFRKILEELALSDMDFRPYSLRRGGATFEMQSHGLMEKTLIRGRWRNSNIARIYISDGLSRLPDLRMSWEAKHKVAKFSSVFTGEHHSFRDGVRGRKKQKLG